MQPTGSGRPDRALRRTGITEYFAEVVEKLNKEINAGLADPKIKARFADLGVTPLVVSPADFGRLIADETEKWGNVIRTLNIKAE